MSKRKGKSGNKKQVTDASWDVFDKFCRIGKIANNLERHGDEEMPAFQLPVEAMMLSGEEASRIVGDQYFDRSVLDEKRGARKACEWLRRFQPLRFADAFENAVVLMTVSGDRELEFHDCRVKNLRFVFDAAYGDQIEARFDLYLHPGLTRENLILQEHQHRDVTLTITHAQVALKKKGKQADLFEAGDESTVDDAEEEELTHPEQLFESKAKRGKKRNGDARAQ